MPTYKSCADENDRMQAPYACALDLVFIPSPDYTSDSSTLFAEHVQAIIQAVFGVKNALNRQDMYTDPIRPFAFYVTDYHYAQNTSQNGKCNPGLPIEWAPSEGNLEDIDLPAWDCNIALSTAGVELDLGFIVHQKSEPDRNRFNLFSSEYNSYAAILHELSHAAFVMSDEAPSPDNSGRFQPKHFPNVYTNVIKKTCEDICGTSCVEIKKLNSNGQLEQAASGFYRCAPSGPLDATNLMYFYPQPQPGNNATWSEYDYEYSSSDRLQYIYEKCNAAKC